MEQILGIDKNHEFFSKWSGWREKIVKYGQSERERKGVLELLKEGSESTEGSRLA